MSWDIIEAERARFERFVEQVLVPTPPEFEPYFQHLACCRVWRGHLTDSGFGRILVDATWLPIQEYARRLYRLDKPFDYHGLGLRTRELRKVLRCTAAGTRNCVHRDHLDWVPIRANQCEPTELKVRDAIRYHFSVPPDHKDRLSMQSLAVAFRLSEARVCRVLLYLDGPEDPRKFEQLRIRTTI